MKIAARLRRLESRARDYERCRVCDRLRGARSVYVLVLPWIDDGHDEADPRPDRCPGCGRMNILRLTFDDGDREIATEATPRRRDRG